MTIECLSWSFGFERLKQIMPRIQQRPSKRQSKKIGLGTVLKSSVRLKRCAMNVPRLASLTGNTTVSQLPKKLTVLIFKRDVREVEQTVVY